MTDKPANDIQSTVATTRAYYDGPADDIYRAIWGDNLHQGMPCGDACPLPEAMQHTNRFMAEAAGIGEGSHVLDLGCGYGETARYLAATHGCHVTGINISERELERAHVLAQESGLANLLTFEYGEFHHLAYPDGSFNVAWSQEAFVHAADKRSVLAECLRVLVPGGTLAVTDLLLVRGNTSEADRDRIYDRIKAPEMWGVEDYRHALGDLGFRVGLVRPQPSVVAYSFGWARDQLQRRRPALQNQIAPDIIERTIEALTFWVDSANAGKIGWALFVARKPR